MNETKWIEQGKQLVEMGLNPGELHQFAVSMLTAIYGVNSPQLRSFQQSASALWGKWHPDFVSALSRGAIKTTIRELENGLVASLRASVQGELLGDIVSLAKEALLGNSEPTKNVAAVLAAAAFEDCLRRLAAEKAGLTTRPKLESVVGFLKDADLLKGGNVSLANSLLKFRNDSLHADWQNVTRAQVESCIALTESLLRDHFS